METPSSISEDTTLKDTCGHLCIRQWVGIPASPPRTWTRRKGLPSTGSSVFATRLEIAAAATVQTLSNFPATPAPARFHKMWFPNAAGRSQSFSFPETRIQDETLRWGHNIEVIPCIAGVASARCSRLLCQFGYDVHQGIDVLSPRGRARIADPPGSRFYRPGGFINRASHANSLFFFAYRNKTKTKTASLVRKLWFRSVSCLAERRCSAEVENRRRRHTNHDTATLGGGT